MWPGECPVTVSIEYLKELQSLCLKDRCDVPFSDADLRFAGYIDQNCNAALHVVFSNDASPYVRAVVDLMNPFLQPCSNPNKMQKMYTQKYNNPSIMEKNTGDVENTPTFREKCFSVP